MHYVQLSFIACVTSFPRETQERWEAMDQLEHRYIK